MSGVNVTVVGHVGQDPVLYTSERGTRWTSIRVAFCWNWHPSLMSLEIC